MANNPELNKSMGDSDSSPHLQKHWRWIHTVIITGIAGLVLWSWGKPRLLEAKKVADRATAISSLKGLSMCLNIFKEEYGRYPDESTAPLVKANTNTPLDLSGSSSNRLFRQIIATGLKSEVTFFTPLSGYRRGDDRFDDDAHALAPGETGFSYLTSASSSDWSGSEPMVVAPLLHGTDRFDPGPFGNRAVVLSVEKVVMALPIDAEGAVYPSPGQKLLDPKAAYWNGNAPVIHWCEEPKPR